MNTVTSVDAQNRFGELLDLVQREPVTITRRGRTVAFVVSPTEYEAMVRGTATAHSAALLSAARAAVSAFRGSGLGGSVARLRRDRAADQLREAGRK